MIRRNMLRCFWLVSQLALCNTYYTGTKLSHNVSCPLRNLLDSGLLILLPCKPCRRLQLPCLIRELTVVSA